MNNTAFTQHSANFRSQVIDDCFNHLGIPTISQRTLNQGEFRDYLRQKLEVSEGNALNVEEAFYLLNHLAERRNDVAHGVPSEILRNDILEEYIEFFEKYSSAIIALLASQILDIELSEWGISFGEITGVYEAGRVVCFHTLGVPFNVGDFIVGRNNNKILRAKIESIQIDGGAITSVNDQRNYEVGVKIDNSFKKNFKLYLQVTPE